MQVLLTPLEKDTKQRGVSDVSKGFEVNKTRRVQYQIFHICVPKKTPNISG